MDQMAFFVNFSEKGDHHNLRCPVHMYSTPKKFEIAALFSTVRPTFHTNPSRKRNFS